MTTTLRDIIERPSPNHSPRDPAQRVDTILLHHTGSTSTEGALAELCNGSRTHRDGSARSRTSAHCVVAPNGDVYQLVSEDRTAWHAGVSCLPWERQAPGGSVNRRSIGIEIVNPGDGKTPFTEAQYLALEWLVPDILSRMSGSGVYFDDEHTLPMPPSARHAPQAVYILGHRDVAPGRKTDPADNFRWDRIRKALEQGRVA